YAFEVVESMHYLGDKNFPDFDFNRFVKYLLRGLWPFLWQLILTLPFVVLTWLGIAVLILTHAIPVDGTVTDWLILIAIGVGILLLLTFLLGMVLVPTLLRAGLSQDFAFTATLAFAWDFIKRMWWELILTQLFVWVTAPLVALVGLLFCCVGVYPAAI